MTQEDARINPIIIIDVCVHFYMCILGRLSIRIKFQSNVLHPYLPTMGGRAHGGALNISINMVAKNVPFSTIRSATLQFYWKQLGMPKSAPTVTRAGVLKQMRIFHALAFEDAKKGGMKSR